MEIFITGKGNVATAFMNLLKKQEIEVTSIDSYDFKPVNRGILLMAVTDSVSKELLNKYYPEIPENLKIIVFSPEVFHLKKNFFLLHPYSSIKNDTDILSLPFTLWGEICKDLDAFIFKLGIMTIKKTGTPSPAYHISAVLCGNFTQILILAAKKLLENENFSESETELLIKSLLKTSSENILKSGIKGFTGPAARKDFQTISSEQQFLEKNNPSLTEIYIKITEKIMETIDNGNIF